MNQIPSVWIRSLKSLTDARYFAAMGINGISMEVDENTLPKWYAIRDWVEGIKTGIEPTQHDDNFVARIYIDAKPDVLIIPESSSDIFPNTIPRIITGITTQSYTERCIRLFQHSLDLSALPEEDLLEADWHPDLIREVLDKGYRGGFCFLGEPEEQTGIRDYTLMDEMLEILGR